MRYADRSSLEEWLIQLLSLIWIADGLQLEEPDMGSGKEYQTAVLS